MRRTENNGRRPSLAVLALAALLMVCCPAWAQTDGHQLWLGMQPNSTPAQVQLDASGQPSPMVQIALDELRTYWHGAPLTLQIDKTGSNEQTAAQGDDGFTITRRADGNLLLRAHGREQGLLYGAYHLLRQQQTGQPVNPVDERPAFQLRILNHWDNLDGSIERGYAGRSIFWSNAAQAAHSPSLLQEYARANASIGINATVLNNVNASPRMLATEYLDSVRAIADVLRPYGLRVFLSVNFASPMTVGVKGVNNGQPLATADPLDPQVAAWWKKKSDEIYQLIPDFGGFLVKANSEGQPGPGDYQRTHAEGANMMADALAPHGGIVMWRAFVYGYHDGNTDRVMKAAAEFKPLDGQFRKNVIVQIKNGPLDFQPREPYSPLFDQLKQTPMMPELQITQEYLGQSRHLVYLGPMWQEFFRVLDLSRFSAPALPAIAGVANIGLDANWCGHHFSQANWYVFGRLAWNPTLQSRDIAREWLQQTFSSDEHFLVPMTDVMQTSHEACVDYMMPLGLHHIFKGDHHYGPEPEGNQPNFPDEWKPVWYHKAGRDGIGFNRSTHGGTGATQQYRQPLSQLYDDVQTCPQQYLLWFHHLPWGFIMPDGTTLWQSLQQHYNHGVQMVDSYVETWQQMRPYVDSQRYHEVNQRLRHQQLNAREWRNHCIGYFRQFAE